MDRLPAQNPVQVGLGIAISHMIPLHLFQYIYYLVDQSFRQLYVPRPFGFVCFGPEPVGVFEYGNDVVNRHALLPDSLGGLPGVYGASVGTLEHLQRQPPQASSWLPGIQPYLSHVLRR